MKKKWLILPFILVFIFTFLPLNYLFAAPTEFNGHYYEVIHTPEVGGKYWTDAKNAAESLTYNDGSVTYEGYLVTITSQEEQDFIITLLQNLDYSCWIGAYQEPSPGDGPADGWYWVTGESWGYTNWVYLEPNDKQGLEDNEENYAATYASGEWNDLGNVEYFTSGYIVEYNKPTEVTKSVGTAEPVWVRTMPMTCYRVWINEDNNFQFLFWYPYADNNWVRIYDMAGNMVYEVDMPYDNPNLIVDLPDGMYTVKTFHDQSEPLQEFIIGKP